MQAEATVSVIIIFLNGEKYLEEAIRSVLAQTLTAWELFLVDDGSTDGSTGIARGFAEQFPEKIHYLEHEGHENRGMSASRNLGIARASGEYIAFLDADDVWFPEKLEKQVAILRANPEAAFLASPTLRCYDDGVRAQQPMALPPGLLPVGTWIPRILDSDDNTSVPSTAMVRTKVLRDVGGFEESFRGLFEDQITWFKINLTAPIYFHPEPLILYRIHADSCCVATPMEQYRPVRVKLYTRLTELIQERAWPCPQLGLLLAIARARLGEVLAESNGHAPPAASRERIGPMFSSVLLLESVSKGAAAKTFHRMFVLLTATHQDGVRGGAKSLLGMAAKGARKIAPHAVAALAQLCDIAT